MRQGLRITDAYAVTAAGNGLAAALGAVATGLSAVRRNRDVTLADAEGDGQPVRDAPALDHDSSDAREDELVETLLGAMTANADRTISATPTEPVWLLCAGDNAPYQVSFDRQALSQRVHETCGVTPELVSADTGGTPALKQLRETMINGNHASAWLIGVESFLKPRRIAQISRRYPVYHTHQNGLIPGEAAAAVRLELGNGDAQAPAVAGLASAREASSDADRKATTGLSTAISHAAQQAGTDPAQLDTHISDDLGDQPADREWWECVQTLWPTRIDERQRRALELGMIERARITYNEPRRYRPAASLGHVGAASLPLQLGLAARHRQWRQRSQPFELAEGPAPILLTEHPLTGDRHAVVVTD